MRMKEISAIRNKKQDVSITYRTNFTVVYILKTWTFDSHRSIGAYLLKGTVRQNQGT